MPQKSLHGPGRTWSSGLKGCSCSSPRAEAEPGVATAYAAAAPGSGVWGCIGSLFLPLHPQRLIACFNVKDAIKCSKTAHFSSTWIKIKARAIFWRRVHAFCPDDRSQIQELKGNTLIFSKSLSRQERQTPTNVSELHLSECVAR